MNSKTKGILCIVTAAFCFAFMSLCVRLAGDLPSMQKILFRNLLAFFIVGAGLVRKPGQVGSRFRKELPPFVPLSATCSGLTIPLLSLSHVSMSHHGKYVFRYCKFYDGLCGLSTWIFSRRLKKYAADTR